MINYLIYDDDGSELATTELFRSKEQALASPDWDASSCHLLPIDIPPYFDDDIIDNIVTTAVENTPPKPPVLVIPPSQATIPLPGNVAVTFRVLHADRNSVRVANVTASVPEHLKLEFEFFKALQRAVTLWVDNTEEGEEAWEGAINDIFNVEDLRDNLKDEKLQKYLTDHRIYDLKIEIEHMNATNFCEEWEFDDQLVDVENMKNGP